MESIVARLEAAVSRLEANESLRTQLSDLAARLERMAAVDPAAKPSTPCPSSSSASAPAAPPAPAAAAAAAAAPAPEPEAPVSPAVRAFEEDIGSAAVGAFLSLSEKIKLPAPVIDKVRSAFSLLATIIHAASECKKPGSDGPLSKLLTPLGQTIADLGQIGDDRRSEWHLHAKTVAEGLQALSWVGGIPAPCSFIDDMIGAAEFYANKILVANKNKTEGADHVDWVRAFKSLLTGLRDYVKEHHRAGLAWNPAGKDLTNYQPRGSSASPKSAAPAAATGAPLPPPPPPPPANFLAEVAAATAAVSASTSAASSDRAATALFSELNRGDAVTSGLRKVTSDMKTKNRTDRQSVVPASATASTKATASSSAPVKVQKPARTELENDKRWAVEYHVGGRVEVEISSPSQSVYVLGCKDTVVIVKGKANSICVDSCIKTGVVFENALSCCEIVNCKSVQVQCEKRVPSVSIDKTAGCQLFLSQEGKDLDIYTSNISEINVVVAAESPDQDPTEIPVPEQYISRFSGAALITKPNVHSSA